MKIGDRIWRPVMATVRGQYPKACFDFSKLVADEPEFQPGKNGGLIFRATDLPECVYGEKRLLYPAFAGGWDWIAIPGAGKYGMVAICHRPVPDEWIYFEIVGLANSGKCVFVEPRIGSQRELLAVYDTQTPSAFRQYAEYLPPEKLERLFKARKAT